VGSGRWFGRWRGCGTGRSSLQPCSTTTAVMRRCRARFRPTPETRTSSSTPDSTPVCGKRLGLFDIRGGCRG
jgi:hypothetical protein